MNILSRYIIEIKNIVTKYLFELNHIRFLYDVQTFVEGLSTYIIVISHIIMLKY